MLKTIVEFFERHMGGVPAAAVEENHKIQVATAALLVEMVRMDGEIQPAEREAVLRLVWSKFDLSAVEAATLVQLAVESIWYAKNASSINSTARIKYETVRFTCCRQGIR